VLLFANHDFGRLDAFCIGAFCRECRASRPRLTESVALIGIIGRIGMVGSVVMLRLYMYQLLEMHWVSSTWDSPSLVRVSFFADRIVA